MAGLSATKCSQMNIHHQHYLDQAKTTACCTDPVAEWLEMLDAFPMLVLLERWYHQRQRVDGTVVPLDSKAA
jgi:hypothetical protein